MQPTKEFAARNLFPNPCATVDPRVPHWLAHSRVNGVLKVLPEAVRAEDCVEFQIAQFSILILAALGVLRSTDHDTSPSLFRPGCDHHTRLNPATGTIAWPRLLCCYLWNRFACGTVIAITKMVILSFCCACQIADMTEWRINPAQISP
jgi:hypothetical protein